MGSPPQGGGPNHSNTNSEVRNKDLMQKICDLEKFCSALQNEVSNLKLENEKLKSAVCANNNKPDINSTTKTCSEVYETDEEELARETDWILKKKRPSKKRKAESSPEVVTPSKSADSVNDSTKATKKEVNKTPRPPPIIINGNNDFKKLHSQLTTTIKNKFFIKLLNNDACKVITFDSCDYRSVTKLLSNENIPWHSYEDKQNRPIKVIVKNLHHSCDNELIVNDLKSQGLNALSAINKLKWKTKEPLEMFLITFDSSEDVKKIFTIRNILNTIVKVEPVKSTNLIPQCKKCQSFGHTKNFCGKPSRCVKCAGKHATIDCKKTERESPKCCNCGESHPANYRGCIVARELQKIRMKKRSQNPKSANNTNDQHTIPERAKTVTSLTNNPTKLPNTNKPATYAQVTKNVLPNQSVVQNPLAAILSKLNEQGQIFKSIEQRLCALEQNMQFFDYD